MSDNLQLPARTVKEGEIVRPFTVTIKADFTGFNEAFEKARAALAAFRLVYPGSVVIPGVENLDDGAIDVEPTK